MPARQFTTISVTPILRPSSFSPISSYRKEFGNERNTAGNHMSGVTGRILKLWVRDTCGANKFSQLTYVRIAPLTALLKTQKPKQPLLNFCCCGFLSLYHINLAEASVRKNIKDWIWSDSPTKTIGHYPSYGKDPPPNSERMCSQINLVFVENETIFQYHVKGYRKQIKGMQFCYTFKSSEYMINTKKLNKKKHDPTTKVLKRRNKRLKRVKSLIPTGSAFCQMTSLSACSGTARSSCCRLRKGTEYIANNSERYTMKNVFQKYYRNMSSCGKRNWSERPSHWGQ